MSQIKQHDSAPTGALTTHRDPESKVAHIDACIQDDVEYAKTTGLEAWRFNNEALPELSLSELSIQTTLAGKTIAAPLMVAPMTGGTERGQMVNQRLANAAQRWNLPMGVGSQRLAIETESREKFYHLRKQAPDAVLFANFGGAQLASGWGVDEARRAVDMIEADAIFIHLNPIQEAIQGGDLDFRGLTQQISKLVTAMRPDGVPIYAREVGFGMSQKSVRQLVDCGVDGIDCAGAGGTSWAKVEARCARTPRRRSMGEAFGEWGIPTADSIINVRAVHQDISLIACGGLRNGIDVAKSLALGANIGAMARPFLLAALNGDDAIDQFIEQTLTELKICMFGSAAATINDLRQTELVLA